jgi:S1-C subfamily serine protease
MRRLIALVFTCLVLSGMPALAETVPNSVGQLQLSFAPVVKTTAPAVVNVYSKTLATQDSQQSLFNDPFFRQFFGDRGNFRRPRKQAENSLGSGVIVDASGLIVTNNHVIRGGTDIRVVLADKREFAAKLLLADERSDLAVLKIDVGEEELAALPFGDSDTLEVGDLVLAIGNPFGVRRWASAITSFSSRQMRRSIRETPGARW